MYTEQPKLHIRTVPPRNGPTAKERDSAAVFRGQNGIKVKLDPLDPEDKFSYLRCTITYNNRDWVALYQNLGKARSWRGMVSRVLDNTGAMMRSRKMLYKAVVQTVLLYRINSWVITGVIMEVLEEFHHQITRRLRGKMSGRVGEESCE